MTRTLRGRGRAISLAAVTLAMTMVAPGGALAAHPIGRTGTPGQWAMTDRAAEPGAKCSYDGGGTLGSIYLTSIKMRHGVQLRGRHTQLRSVGYRPILQHRVGGTWVTAAKGTLLTGQASLAHWASLPKSSVKVPVTSDPGRFRLVLRLIWYRADASIEGTRRVVIDDYVRRSGGVGSSCAGVIALEH